MDKMDKLDRHIGTTEENNASQTNDYNINTNNSPKGT
jgi:hypothetical protein